MVTSARTLTFKGRVLLFKDKIVHNELQKSAEYDKLSWSVRQARPDDAKSLAQLQSQLWQETYMRPGQDERNEYIFKEAMGYLEPDRIKEREEIIQEAREENSGQSYFVLEAADGEIVGMLYGVHTTEHQELVALYVSAIYQGNKGGRHWWLNF
jgi:hypothetical protein